MKNLRSCRLVLKFGYEMMCKRNYAVATYVTFRLIHAYGKPVGVSNAGKKRRPKSLAKSSN